MRVHGSEVRSRWVGRATWNEPMRVRDVGIIIDPVANIRGQAKKNSVLAYSASRVMGRMDGGEKRRTVRARAAEFPFTALRLLLSLVQFLASPLTIHIP